MLPNFIIIGAGKSGTTTLYEWLKQHPEVYMSPVKETNFFALEGQDIIKVDEDPKQLNHYPWSVTDRNAYESLFDGVTSEKAVGEVSPMYLYSPRAPKTIKETIPDVKIITTLREPVDRLHSRFMHLARESREPKQGYSDVFEKDSIWWERNDLVREGFYGQNLERYFELFPKSNIKVYLYEDLKNHPLGLMKDLFSFIGVDRDFSVDTSIEFNPSGKIKNKALDAVIGQNSEIKKALKRIAPGLVEQMKGSQTLIKHLTKWRKRNLNKEPMPNALRAKMLEEIYAPEIQITQRLIGRDLSHWLN